MWAIFRNPIQGYLTLLSLDQDLVCILLLILKGIIHLYVRKTIPSETRFPQVITIKINISKHSFTFTFA